MAPHSRYAPSTHVAVVQKYPMYVLPLKKVLALEKIQSHEELWQELVQVTEPEQMTIIFCSHTWLRSAHPDDAENSKLALLQAVLRRAIDGKLQINAHWLTEINGLGNNRITAVELQRDLAGAFCWFDYWSVPQSLSAQHEQALAIESIVSYVSQCRYFFVLAGAWRHENGSLRDVRAWQARGWCKMEQLAEVLAGSNRPIVCESPSATYLSGFLPQEAWAAAPVGLQNFTVAADVQKLGPVISTLLEGRKDISSLQPRPHSRTSTTRGRPLDRRTFKTTSCAPLATLYVRMVSRRLRCREAADGGDSSSRRRDLPVR